MTTTNQRAVEELLRELAGDCEVAYGVTEQSYRQFCDSGAKGRMPNDTWAEHCQRRKQQIEQAIATLRAPGWRPISEAPRDRTLILVYFPTKGVRAVAWDSSWSENLDEDGLWCVDDDKHGPYGLRGYRDDDESAPTHWQPLPPPPGEAA